MFSQFDWRNTRCWPTFIFGASIVFLFTNFVKDFCKLQDLFGLTSSSSSLEFEISTTFFSSINETLRLQIHQISFESFICVFYLLSCVSVWFDETDFKIAFFDSNSFEVWSEESVKKFFKKIETLEDWKTFIFIFICTYSLNDWPSNR